MPSPSETAPVGRRAPEGWWEDPGVSTAQEAFAIFDATLEKHRHLRQRHVQEIIKRCKSGADLQLAVTAMEKLMRFRRAQQHHEPFNQHTSKMLVEAGLELKAPEVLMGALSRHIRLGLDVTSQQVLAVSKLLATSGDIEGWERLFALARKSGFPLSSNLAFHGAKAAKDVAGEERAQELLNSLHDRGLRVRPGVWRLVGLEGPSSPSTTKDDAPTEQHPETDAPGTSGTPPGADSTSAADDGAEAADDAAERKDEGATAPATSGAPPGVAS